MTATTTKPRLGSSGISIVHRQRAEAEVDDADADLQQRQRPARSVTLHGPRPTDRGWVQTQTT